MKNTSSELIISELEDRIRPPLVIFFKNVEKITTTRSSANFLSPEPNGQGYYVP